MTDTATTPREGSLEAPFRHPIAWRDPDFYDLGKVEAEMERVFEICHGCRRCFNLCDSFPRLFDLIDEGPTGEIDGVPKEKYGEVTEACTLSDMCFMTKCPYVPPHEWAVDFPHLLLRHRSAKRKAEGGEWVREQLGETDRNGKLAGAVAPLANWASAKANGLTRPVMEATLGIDRTALLPKYHSRKATDLPVPAPDPTGPAFGKRRAVIYATCFADYNHPATAAAATAVLARQGVELKMVYPVCCGMPQLEAGDLAEVADRATRVAAELAPYIADGWDVVTLTASCGLMMKFEWPLILPESQPLRTLSGATKDVCEYVVALAKAHGLAEGLTPIEGGVTLHHACHARAQNMGAKSAEMLRLIPGTKVDLVERCSGHGGTFGVMKETHGVAVKVGKPAARQVAQKGNATLCSDCPLACQHLGDLVAASGVAHPNEAHPIELIARAYRLA
jgi:glycerol-3-phosphate dehydrogenase subunit C